RPRGRWEGGVPWEGGVAEIAADTFMGRMARGCIDGETEMAVGATGGVEADPVTARDQLQAGREAELGHRRGEAARLAERGRARCHARALRREAEQAADVAGEDHCRNGNHRCDKRGYQSASAWPEVARLDRVRRGRRERVRRREAPDDRICTHDVTPSGWRCCGAAAPGIS